MNQNCLIRYIDHWISNTINAIISHCCLRTIISQIWVGFYVILNAFKIFWHVQHSCRRCWIVKWALFTAQLFRKNLLFDICMKWGKVIMKQNTILYPFVQKRFYHIVAHTKEARNIDYVDLIKAQRKSFLKFKITLISVFN